LLAPGPRSWVIAAAGWFSVLLRLAYLGVTNAFAVLRLLPLSNRDKDVEILALRHQLTVLERQLGKERVRFDTSDRAWLAALLHWLPSDVLRSVRLLVRPDTMLRWHRNLLARRHAAISWSKRPGPPRTVRSVRVLVLRLARENPSAYGFDLLAFCRWLDGDAVLLSRSPAGPQSAQPRQPFASKPPMPVGARTRSGRRRGWCRWRRRRCR
jgi:hypothetical protein